MSSTMPVYKLMYTEYPDVVTPKQLSVMLDCSLKKTYQKLKSGEIKSFKVGIEYRIPKIYVFEYMGFKIE